MKNFICFAALFTLNFSALAADYTVDATHSRVGFSVRHLIGKVTGEFKEFEGTFAFDEKALETAKVKVTAKTDSIFTNNEKRDDHLRQSEFFYAEKHPTLSFVGKKLSVAGERKYKLEGELTMRGVTKPVVFDVEYSGAMKDPWGNMRAAFTATTTVNRKDFGIKYNKTLDGGSLMIGEDVQITLDIEAIQAKETPKT